MKRERRKRLRRKRNRRIARLAADTVRRLLGPLDPWAGIGMNVVPPEANIYDGRAYLPDLPRKYIHWNRLPPPGRTGGYDGFLWGCLCKHCRRGFEGASPTAAVRQVCHSSTCSWLKNIHDR